MFLQCEKNQWRRGFVYGTWCWVCFSWIRYSAHVHVDPHPPHPNPLPRFIGTPPDVHACCLLACSTIEGASLEGQASSQKEVRREREGAREREGEREREPEREGEERKMECVDENIITVLRRGSEAVGFMPYFALEVGAGLG